MLKTKLFLPALCFLLHLETHAQWRWLNPQPSGYLNNKIIFANSSHGFILNYNGDLYQTKNEGKTWRWLNNFPNALGMDFKDSTGVVVGANGTAYLTIDMGANWKQVSTGTNTLISSADIINRDTFFLSEESAYSQGLILKTTDGGISFDSLDCGAPVTAMFFINQNIGYVGRTQASMLKTEDGGLTWKQLNQGNTANVISIQFLDKDTGYAFQSSNSLLKTTDGGTTWTKHYVNEPIRTMHFVSTKDGYLGGEDGVMYATHDGGETFTWASFANGINDYNDIYSVYFLSKDIGFAVGLFGRIMKTTNSCKTWQSYSPFYTNVNSLSFANDSICYAATNYVIYKSVNRGNSWSELGLTTGIHYADYSAFEKVYFKNADTGFVISSDPAEIHRTYDGGKTWDTGLLSQYEYSDVTDVQFLNADTGYATLTDDYGNGMIVKTKDGGRTWEDIWGTPNSHEYFKKVYYINEDTGYAIRYAQLFKTSDGSKTWKVVYTSPYSEVKSVAFTSALKGIAVDDAGLIITTIDGGNTWSDDYLMDYNRPTDGISEIKFANPQIGYVAGYHGIYKTLDSGRTWQLDQNVNTSNLSFTKDSSVYAAGFGGTIITSKIFPPAPKPVSFSPDSGSLGTVVNITGKNFKGVFSVKFGGVAAASFRIIDDSTLSAVVGDGASGNIVLKNAGGIDSIGIFTYTCDSVTSPIPNLSLYQDSILVSSNANYYRWYFNNTLTGDTLNKLRIRSAGFYRVETSTNKICWLPSLDYPVIINNNSLPDSLKMTTYPNPSTGKFTVDVKLPVVTTAEAYIKVYNSNGSQVLETNKLIFYGNEIRIPLNINNKGTFFLKVFVNDESIQQTIIIM